MLVTFLCFLCRCWSWILTLYVTNFINHKLVFTFYVIPPQWYDTGSWNPSSCKTRTYLVYIVNIMAADVLATQGARASDMSNHDIDKVTLYRDNSVPAHWDKSLALGRCGCNFEIIIFKLISSAYLFIYILILSISYIWNCSHVTHTWMAQDVTHYYS